ncbi:MAG: hypothetical protein IPK17_20640 [Chloroflexi bacterium]|uniref:hypothetical protein n=1 Tax=Candidatus Flexifilum breve TaxID=3140694 RepID=UPI0031369388|nr:hypothetical protein [Chloroflexota bacterium]
MAFQIVFVQPGSTAHASLYLLLGLYRALFVIRVALLIAGVLALSLVTLWQQRRSKPVVRFLASIYLTFLMVLISEVLGTVSLLCSPCADGYLVRRKSLP